MARTGRKPTPVITYRQRQGRPAPPQRELDLARVRVLAYVGQGLLSDPKKLGLNAQREPLSRRRRDPYRHPTVRRERAGQARQRFCQWLALESRSATQVKH